MLENLYNLIKEQATTSIVDNPDIPNDQNNAVLASATHSVAESLQGVLASGGLQSVLSMFAGGNRTTGDLSGLLNNPIVGNIISSFTNKLTTNHGMPVEQAGTIANNLIPNVINDLVKRTNDPANNGFDINSLIGSLTGGVTQSGGNGFDLQGILNKLSGGGLDSDGDGSIELDDIISKIKGGAQQQQAQTGSGGIMDVIQGFLK